MIPPWEEEIVTVCYMCYNCCGIKVRKRNGTLVDIAGDGQNPYNQGKLCAKGKAGIMSLYHPGRLTIPMKRTNPQKGMGIDPGWQEISWEEALETLATKLAQVRKEDPRKLVVAGLDFHHFITLWAFASAFGTPNIWRGGADYFCGNGLHSVLYLTNGTFQAKPDLEHCNYCLLIGNQLGFMVGSNAVPMTRKMAEARARGMKLVVIDPVGTSAAAKADEWIPIRPGTDGAFALGLLNLLLNEYGLYDGEFLRQFTNGSYLVGPDGLYQRDGKSGKPLAFSLKLGQVVGYDAVPAGELALEGSYEVEGVTCRPAFQLLKDRIKDYKPEIVAQVTSVPAEILCRVAREFGQAARIGSKITIQGRELPYRPAVANWSRGAIAHKHALSTAFAIQLLNIAVGAMDVPGGQLGSNPVGPWWSPREGPDGLLLPADIQLIVEGAYPARKASRPVNLELMELFPVASYAAPFFEEAVLNPEKFSLPYRPEIMIHCHSNLMMNTSSPGRIAQVLEKIPFIASFVFKMDETTEWADLLFPDAHYLERLYPFPNHAAHFITEGLGEWYWMMGQPAVSPQGEARAWQEVVLELADRLDIRPDLYAILNRRLSLKEPFRLDPAKSYSWEEVADTWAKSWFGAEHDLNWFYEKGWFVSAPKKVEEAYPRPFITPKIPLYLEHLIKAGQDVKEVTQELGLDWDVSGYQPLPEYKPCLGTEEARPGYDLFPVNFKVPFHTFAVTRDNPWLDEVGNHHPYAYKIWINSRVAEKKGIENGREVWVESNAGKIKGVAKVTECIHPEVLGIAGTFGHWAGGPEKGAHFNSLLPSDLSRIDMVTTALDCCVKVKVYKPIEEV